MARMSKLFDRATNAMVDLETHTEKSVEAFVERVGKAKDRTDAVMLKKHEHIDNHMTDLTEFEKDLDAFDGSNGGPLEGGGDTSEPGERTAWTPPKT